MALFLKQIHTTDNRNLKKHSSITSSCFGEVFDDLDNDIGRWRHTGLHLPLLKAQVFDAVQAIHYIIDLGGGTGL